MTTRRENQFVSIPTTSDIADGVQITIVAGDLRAYNLQMQFHSVTPGATVKIEVLGAANHWFVEAAALVIDNNPIWIPSNPVANVRFTFSGTLALNRTGLALELR